MSVSELRALQRLLQRAEAEKLILKVEDGLITAYEGGGVYEVVDDGQRYADIGDFLLIDQGDPGKERP